MIVKRDKITREFLLTKEQCDELIGKFGAGRKISVGPIPPDKDYGPGWVEEMNKAASKEWLIEEWDLETNVEIDGVIYYAPRFVIFGYSFMLHWSNNPELQYIFDSSEEESNIVTEGNGAVAILGSLAIVAGIALFNKNSSYKTEKKKIKVVQEI